MLIDFIFQKTAKCLYIVCLWKKSRELRRMIVVVKATNSWKHAFTVFNLILFIYFVKIINKVRPLLL